MNNKRMIKRHIILFLFLNLFDIIIPWRCGADQLRIKPGFLNITKEEKKKKINKLLYSN